MNGRPLSHTELTSSTVGLGLEGGGGGCLRGKFLGLITIFLVFCDVSCDLLDLVECFVCVCVISIET